MKILVIDNYDSFTYNLVDYVSQHAETAVYKNSVELSTIRSANPDGIIISPGPGHPKNDRDVGVSKPVITELSPSIPTLGVCLGLETAVYAHGGVISHAPDPIHGKAYSISHDEQGIFRGIEQGFQGGRYHSLIASDIPDCFTISATTVHDNTELVMAVRHREDPLIGVQFHPESVLTAVGHDVIENFLTITQESKLSLVE